ncbi:MAG: DUF1800 domain-containing protein [Paracoccus sp. (in: a-proteobacteria)]|uniref:DUF1800 domain-containing protein n=1 Tax=Paracoccus sp. TaxID=267 RepID=UPI0039E49247
MSFGFPEIAAIRLGYGLSPLFPPPADPAAVLDSLPEAAPGPDAISTDQAREIALRLADLTRARKTGGEAELEAFRVVNKQTSALLAQDLQRRVVRALDAPVGFGERLVQFWADHFTVSPKGQAQNALAMAFVDEVVRPHLAGRFEDMFFAAETHPMMLLYLDQNSSRGPNSPFARNRPEREIGLNENLAREALELHSMGVGAPYTQTDVRELAELLTGLTYTAKQGFTFNRNAAEPGAETVLGVSYGGRRQGGLDDIRQALHDIARRPETAQHVSRKLAVHFISDEPSENLLRAMVARWRDTDGDLPQVYRSMIAHPDLGADLRDKVRQPFDYIVAALRALGVTGAQVAALDMPEFQRLIGSSLTQMGQNWLRPTGPDGWPEEPAAWVSPQLLAARINFALRVPAKLVPALPDPRALLGTALGGTQSEALAWAVPKAESQAEGVALVLASNDFNRR